MTIKTKNLEQYDIISLVNENQQPKGNIIIRPAKTLAKREFLKKRT